MPTVVTQETLPLLSPELLRRRWTREECEDLEKTGIFDGQHLELIEGELFNKMGKRRPHVNALHLMVVWLTQVFGAQFVNHESPIDVAPEDNHTSEPEPDIVILRRGFLEFTSANPRADDLHLLVEVSDTSIYLDLKTKAAVYARAGVVEYWVLDVNRRRLIVHRMPQAGRYISVVTYGEKEVIAPLAAPQSKLRISDVLAD